MSAGSVAAWHDDSDVPKMELLDACYRNDIRKATESLKFGVPVDATDDDFVTPLHIAAFTGNRELALLLLDSGADLEATSRTGMTAFLHACREGKMEVIDLLLQKGADIMKLTRMGASALTLAAAGGHLEVIKKLVGLRVPVSGPSDTCPTPLITAVFRNFSPICVYLIGKGAPLDAVDNLLGLSALSCAVLLFNRSMLITLLDKGADPNKRAYMKRSAYELAQSLKRQDAVNLFYQRMTGRNSERKDVRQALMEDDFDRDELLQQRRLRLPSGCSPLHFSVAIGNINAVRCLAGDGMFLDEGEQKFGLSPLQTAALLGQSDVIYFLLERGASTYYLNQHKMTAFDYYVANGGEANENIRTALHCFRQRKSDLSLSGSSGNGTLRKVLPTSRTVGMLSRKLLGEKPTELPSVEARQWRETRMHTFPMQGRNYRKFVTVEDLLHQERSLFPKKSNNDDTVMDVVRALASEATSFTVPCFYDWYSVGAEKRSNKMERRGEQREYDVAIANSLAYGYRRPEYKEPKPKAFPYYPIQTPTIVYSRENSDSGGYNSFRKIAAGYSETPSANQSRQTPRMLKKSKDSIEVEKHPEMRKSISTGQLQSKGPPKVVASATMMAHYSVEQIKFMFLRDLKNHHRLDIVKQLEEAELDGQQMLRFTEQDFIEIGVRDPAALRLLKELQANHSRITPYHGSIH